MIPSLVNLWGEMVPSGELLVKLSVWLALASGAGLYLSKATASFRRWFWRIALVGVFALPLSIASAPEVELPWDASTAVSPPTSAAESFVPASGEMIVRGNLPVPVVTGVGGAIAPLGNTMVGPAAAASADSPAALPVSDARSAAAPAASWPSRSLTWSAVLWTCWLTGIVFLLARLLAAQWRLRKILDQSIPADPGLVQECARAASEVGVRRPPRVLRSGSVSSPLVAGFVRPVLLVPDYFQDLPSAERHACCVHELAHLRSRDLAWSRLFWATCTGLWFHPLAWRAWREHERACEEACDAAGARSLGDARRYAKFLARVGLEVERRRSRGSTSAAFGMAMARRGNLTRRVARLLAGIKEQPMKRRTLAAVLAAASAAVILLGGAQFVSADANPPPATEAPAAWINDFSPIPPSEWNAARAAHLLERAGFGGTPEEVERLAKMSPEAAVDYLVDFEKIDASHLPPFDESGIYPNGHKFLSLQEIVPAALLTGKAFGIKATQEGALAYQPAINEFYTLLVSEHAEMHRAGHWWADRMVKTPRPFEEKLALFWHDHFATSQEKVMRYQQMLAQIDMFRKRGSGNFRDLVIAVAQDPAMLKWLDNKDNVKGKPNENFAREVMELFCMGEGQGYSEADIREVARALTGWTVTPDNTTKQVGKFVDKPGLHDEGTKSFLGATGKFNGYDAIDVILRQPSTPRFVAGKFYRYFVREDLSPKVQDQLAKILLDAKYELKPLYKTIFLSKDFYSPATVGTQIKSPVHLVVSTHRKLGAKELSGIPDFTQTTTNLGQTLFFPPNVAGWADGASWLNPATMLARGNFAYTLLFPDARHYGAPDKEVAEGYRKIPLLFPEYNIKPHVWSAEKRKMVPVSKAEYARHLAQLAAGSMEEGKEMASDETAMADKMPGKMDTGKSKMSQIANNEKYNLAVGVYTGFVQAYDRVKPIERTPAKIDVSAMIRSAGARSADDAVSHLERRFLIVPLDPSTHRSIVEFLDRELGGSPVDAGTPAVEEALRRTLHLILSSPEYQVG